MKRKYVPVRLPEEVLERVKNEAGRWGLSVSETVGILVRKSFESGTENRSEGIGRGAGIDPETIKKMIEEATKNVRVSGPGSDHEQVKKEVDSAIRFGLEPALKAITLLRDEISGLSKNPAPDPARNAPGPVPEIRPEIVQFLAEKAAKTDALLEEVASKITGKNVEFLRAEITAELGKSSAPDYGINVPEMIRFLVEKVARIDALLVEVSSKISGSNVGDHADRMRRVKVWFEAEVKKLFGG